MMRRFLCETTLEGYRALSVGRHLVYDSWDQVHAFLQGTLGEAHAAVWPELARAWAARLDFDL